MAACRRISCLAGKSNFFLHRNSKFSSSSIVKNAGSSNSEIVVPLRIERGPTDILKALASTISKDYTAPRYKYEDDPYFIPASNVAKRAFALSKESGKKAARYFLEKYPELFKCNTSVPHIKAFDPPVVYTEEDELSPEILYECVLNLDVKNCIFIYTELKKRGVLINQETKQNLLELLCFYNNLQPVEEDYYEERYFQNATNEASRWNMKGMAEQLFLDMEKDGKAYSAMICGASKFNNQQIVTSLFDEMTSKNLTGTTEAYNAMILAAPYTAESGDSRWEHALYILRSMQSAGVSPDLYTMNAVLSVLSRTKRWKRSKQLALNILSEMKSLQIEPSLGTYYHILEIYNLDFPDNSALYSIMNHIEGKEWSIRHPTDVRFFCAAMELCWKNARDKELAYRINKLLEFGNNCKLLGNAILESLYYKSFFRLLCEVEDLDKMMVFYEKYVPNIYTPEPSVTYEIIQAIHFNGLYTYLPRLCSDVLIFEHTERENILVAMTEAAGCMKHDEQVQSQLVHILWQIVEKLETRSKGRRTLFSWPGTALGNVLKTFIYGQDFEKAWSIVQKLKDEEDKIIGPPEKESLLSFCEMCFQLKDFDKAFICANYAVQGSYPDFYTDLQKLSTEMFKNQILSEAEKILVLNTIVRKGGIEGSSSDSESSSSDSSSDEESGKEETSVPKL
ncbi:protein PTCD3 homolog, mitochondrial-like [Uloborus diversus]|uniref:protein PTCD3 homolog, mitochondrial-like n=1 Tax=Uloborus diversus TaxID=327109 RepID=UPI00240A6802|nr:protein PTCD3 homolog, mitochondrial-like [Uloborus diversus]